jgi:hypothetical protein
MTRSDIEQIRRDIRLMERVMRLLFSRKALRLAEAQALLSEAALGPTPAGPTAEVVRPLLAAAGQFACGSGARVYGNPPGCGLKSPLF